MSYLGQKILYGIVNAVPDFWAERVMAPEKETGDYLRAHGIPLATLESDTPLRSLDLIGFSITHELCYTNVLYMLDLAGIPLRAEDRPASLADCPLIVAGGGALLGAEPLAPFMDLMVLGDGEEIFPQLLELLRRANTESLSRHDLLCEAHRLPGIYVPGFFAEKDGRLCSVRDDQKRPTRTIVADLDQTTYPTRQVVPIGAVHNRLSIEIARGCTRGCRFCQAGMVYRPVRERSVETIQTLLRTCLRETGFDEVSFLALSTGDYSALKTLSHRTLDVLQKQQISLSLPSQRVGSIDDEIMARMADLRRTGMTLAPEAGSQRLRDVINKGISEEEIILHAQKLVEHGWRMVKLYFMLGLPTETDDDLLAIVDLCCKVRDAAGRGSPRLQVTCALSPFVPKPFTPFQWVEQISQEEIVRRVHCVLDAARPQKCVTVRWHEPAVSHLEGILSRAGREMADCVERAYRKGAIFCSWMEHFSLDPWKEAMAECHLDPADYIRARDLREPLPWDHLEAGISRSFLQNEWKRALEGKRTDDCRYSRCNGCGACDTQTSTSLLHERTSSDTDHPRFTNRMVLARRDQNAHQPHWDSSGRLIVQHDGHQTPRVSTELTQKAVQYRIWHTKQGGAAYLSQLELQSVLERAFRRAGIPVSFSMGFHPLPLLSFGRALPVGVESLAEWFSVSLARLLSPGMVQTALQPFLPDGITLQRLDPVTNRTRSLASERELYRLTFPKEMAGSVCTAFRSFQTEHAVIYTFQTKKGERSRDIRPLLTSWQVSAADDDREQSLFLETSWKEFYLSPIRLLKGILGLQDDMDLSPSVKLLKIAQEIDGSLTAFA